MNIDEKAGIVFKAMKYAERKHKGQVRKGSGSPYFHHPLMVSYIAANFKKSKNLHTLIAAAILHDVVEDCDVKPHTITKMFGMGVSKLVFELTDDKDEIKRIGKVEYQKKKWCGLSNYPGLTMKATITTIICAGKDTCDTCDPGPSGLASGFNLCQKCKGEPRITCAPCQGTKLAGTCHAFQPGTDPGLHLRR